MGLEDQLSSPANRLSKFVGRPATIVNRIIKTDANGDWVTDEYGDPEMETTEHEVSVEVASVGSVSYERRFAGIDTDADAMVLVAADIDIYDGNETDDRAATRIHVDGVVYEVREITTDELGRPQCHCEQL